MFTRIFGVLLGLVVAACSNADTQNKDASPSESLLLNRQRVAQDRSLKPGELAVARISLSAATKQAKAEIEVLARLKSGEEVVIDRLPGEDISSFAMVIDDEGLSVGFFRTWSTKEDIWTSARGSFQIYFVQGQSVFGRTGEMKCKKTKDQGTPIISFHNSRWHGESRILTFNVHATCEDIDYFDGAGLRDMIVLTGRQYEGKQGPYTEESARMKVDFDVAGEIVSAGLAKGDVAKFIEVSKCESGARVSSLFAVCGPDGNGRRRAFWRHDTQIVEYEFQCDDTSIIDTAQGADFFAISCDTTIYPAEKGRRGKIEIASNEAPRGNFFSISCPECKTLQVSRLHYLPERREISFNMETDAKNIKFEEVEVELARAETSGAENKVATAVPIFTIRLNDRWQLIEVLNSIGDNTKRAK